MALGAWKSSKNQGSSLYNPSCVTCLTTGGAEGIAGGGVEAAPKGWSNTPSDPFWAPSGVRAKRAKNTRVRVVSGAGGCV